MTDSYTFNTPIGFLTIREEEKKLTKLFWEANSVQTMNCILIFCMRSIRR